MNIFSNILDKTKQGYNTYNKKLTEVGYKLADIKASNDLKQQGNIIQAYFDDAPNDPKLLRNRDTVLQMLENGESRDFIENYLQEGLGYKKGAFQTSEAIPYSPKFDIQGGLSVPNVAKGVANFGAGAYNTVAGLANLGVTAYQQGVGETAKQVASSAVGALAQGAQNVKQEYQQKGLGGTALSLAEKGSQLAVNNPFEAITTISPRTALTTAKVGLGTAKVGAKAIAPVVNTTSSIVGAPFKSIYNTAKKYTGTPEEISGIQSAIKPKQKIKNGVVQRTQKAIQNEIQLTNGLIRNKGISPVDLDSYANAQKSILTEIGGEIERLTGQPLKVDLSQSSQKIRQLANSPEVQLLDPSESSKLLRIADDIDARGKIDTSVAEGMNQYINDVLKSTTSTASEAYKRGLQILVKDIRDGLDNAISSIPGEFKELKRAYGAVRNVYGDTVSRQIVYNRQNLGGLIDSFGAIEGFGNIASGAGKILTGNVRSGVVDIGKGVTQNAVGRFIKSKNDPNNIIKSIFSVDGGKKVLPNIPSKTLQLPAKGETFRTTEGVRVGEGVNDAANAELARAKALGKIGDSTKKERGIVPVSPVVSKLPPDAGKIFKKKLEVARVRASQNEFLKNNVTTPQSKVTPTTATSTGKGLLRNNKGYIKLPGGEKPVLPKSIPDEFKPLAEEAMKYKTAEEFVKLARYSHGTNAKFETFDKSKIKIDNLSKGFYFFDNPELAKSYAKRRTAERGGEENVIEAMLDIKKPFNAGKPSKKEAESYLEWYYSDSKLNKEQIKEAVKSSLEDVGDDYSLVFPSSLKDIEGWIKKNGYDSLIVPGNDKLSGKDGIAYVVFEPNQIKTKSQLLDLYNLVHKK